MYLHLGKGTVVRTDSIVGIFDLDITSQSHLTRKYLSSAEKAGQVLRCVPGGGEEQRVSEPDGLVHAAAPRGKRHTLDFFTLSSRAKRRISL